MAGFVNANLIETRAIQSRHDELVAEMKRRGYKHGSPLLYKDRLNVGAIDRRWSLRMLLARCPACKERFTAVLVDDCRAGDAPGRP